MASVVINTRFNNRKAEADLKELQARAKETAREINAVEKGFGSAMPDPLPWRKSAEKTFICGMKVSRW